MTLEDDVVRLAARLTRVSGIDERTGLANLQLLMRDLARELARSRRAQPGIHLCVVQPESDVDPVVFGRELRGVAREEDVVARLGDVRFALLVADASLSEGERICRKICDTLRYQTRVSVGWRPVFGNELTSLDAAEIIRQAVSASDAAHAEGGDRVVRWSSAEVGVN